MLKDRSYNEMLVWLAGPQGFEPWVSGSEGLRATIFRRLDALSKLGYGPLSRIDCRILIKG